MSYKVTIFDIEENPLHNFPVVLLQNDTAISETTTDHLGVASFSVDLKSFEKLSVRSKLIK